MRTTTNAGPAQERGLWQPAFRRFWASVLVSQSGSEVTLVAVPLLVITTLGQGSAGAGLVSAAQYLPWLLVSLPAGVLVDRHPSRRVLVACDLLRAATLLAIPLAAWRGFLTLPLVLAVVLAVNALTVVFDVSSGAFLPRIVPRARLGAANGALGTAWAVANVGGPSLGGALVGLVGGARAVLVDALSFGISAVLLAGLAGTARTAPDAGRDQPSTDDDGQPVTDDDAAAAAGDGPGRGAELLAGLRVLRDDPRLGLLSAHSCAFNLASSGILPVLLVFLVREARLTPAAIGLVLGLAAVGAVLGGLVAGRVGERLGVGRALGLSALVVCVGELLLAFTPASSAAAVWVVLVMGTMFAANTIFTSQGAAVRQQLAPPAVLGRVMAAHRLLAYAPIPVGAVVGGLLGDVLGLRTTLVVLGLGCVASVTLALAAPVRGLRAPLEPRAA